MASGDWQPQPQGVEQICQLLHDYQNPAQDQTQIFQQLQRCTAFPDFNNYLTFILTKGENQPLTVRQSAGLLLKNNLKSQFTLLPPQFQSYLKGSLLPLLGASERQLRATVGTAISVIVQVAGVASWPELFTAIAHCLESGDDNHKEGAIDALYKMCEDVPEQLDEHVAGLQQKPIALLLPRLLALFNHPNVAIRKCAVGSVNQFIVHMPAELVLHMDAFLSCLFALRHDAAADVRKKVCSGIVALLEVQPDFLQPHMANVIEYMLQASQDTDEDVALEATEFWSAYCEARLPPVLLRGILPKLVPVLMTNMRYADDDEAVIAAEAEDAGYGDRDQDLRPFFHKSKHQGDLGGDGDGGEDYDEDDADAMEGNVWNVRKCSAAGLDILSTVFGDEILVSLMPLVERCLREKSDAAWKARESAVLALGAVADGCAGGLLPHLRPMISGLVPLLEDARPLVRSITCWTLSRFSKWFMQLQPQNPEEPSVLEVVLMAVLRRVIDNNRKVQEAACSAFATLEEEVAEELGPRLEPILQHLMYAFSKYQRKNLLILYDAIGTLADAVADELNQPQHVAVLMPPLIAKWNSLGDTDRDLFPLLECLTSIAQALGPGFGEYTEPVFTRSVRIVELQQRLKHDPASAASLTSGHRVEYDKEFVICCLDLISGLAEGIGEDIAELVGRSSLCELLLQCCMDGEASDVRQSAFALLGDLAKTSVQHLKPKLTDFLTLAIKNISLEAVQNDSVSVCNNACWAIGEIVIKAKDEVAPFVLPVVGSLVPVLSAQGINKSLLVNSAITLGRLGWVLPSQVAPHMDHFMQPWCTALRSIRDDIEKEHAFMGLVTLVSMNPSGASKVFPLLCEAIASWHTIHNEQLRQGFHQVLHGFQQIMGADGWRQYFGSLPPQVRDKLTALYKL